GAGGRAAVTPGGGDIASLVWGAAARGPALRVGDIDRGGAIASVVGTHALLDDADRARLAGYLINKFRGDVRLFDEGLAIITARTGLPSLGVVPFFAAAATLPAAAGVALARNTARGAAGAIKVAVPRIDCRANFDDLDPLRAEPDVTVELVPPGRPLPGDADLVILPGSKSTMADLALLRAEGWDIDLRAHLRRGGWVLGLCGGYQMLGRRL